MLKNHLDLAKAMGLIQDPTESEYDFRKRVFIEVYPEDGLQAIEILFCVESYSDLRQKDMIFITMAREMSVKGEEGLRKFLKGFASNDPSIPYASENIPSRFPGRVDQFLKGTGDW